MPLAGNETTPCDALFVLSTRACNSATLLAGTGNRLAHQRGTRIFHNALTRRESFAPTRPHWARRKSTAEANRFRKSWGQAGCSPIPIRSIGVYERVQTATRLIHHFALIAGTALSVLCKSLHAREDRIRVEMRFRDDVRFEATASPAVIKIRRQ